MHVQLPDGSQREVQDGATVADIALSIGKGLAKAALAGKVNGKVVDVYTPVPDNAKIEIVTPKSEAGLDTIRHSTAHLMAMAVQELFPGTQVTIGPVIENGFFYDFGTERPFTDDDLRRIEEKMSEIVKRDLPVRREELSRDEAIATFEKLGEKYKVEIIKGIPGDEPLSIYRQGEWFDLCRGPHVPSTGRLGAFKLTSVAGAYWRGDEHNTQLTRIYGTAFYDQADLDAYLERLEQARARDHRRLGVQLDLFHLSDHAPGMPFWHPKGMVIWNALEDLRRRENLKRGYVEVKTPLLYDVATWVTSGHWDKFKDEMFLVPYGDRELGLKPMNCPGHMLLFGSGLRSYRDLPLRYAESSTLHRNERAGTLHGLLRVQHVTQDDAHMFVTPEQIEEEIFGCLDFAAYLYDLFGMEARFELSTRPDNKLGTDEEWDFTEGALRNALDRRGIEYTVNEGDGAFYGPKIDLHMTDVLGRSWQMGTIQLDSQMPARFELKYMGEDNAEHTPYVIHRALFGSLERFIGILVEHYAGAFPFWLAPVQIRVIPIGEAYRAAAHELAGKLGEYRVEVDERNETVGKRIRDAEVEKIPVVILFGEKESDESLAVRERGGEQSTKSLAELREYLATL